MIWNILCPKCGATLDVTDRMLGDKVECGGCAHIFTAPTEALPAPDPRYDRRVYEEDDPSDDTDDRTPGKQKGQGRAIASLVLGILALTLGTLAWFVCCPSVQTVTGVLAILFGFFGMKTEGRKFAIAGMVMGALASILSLLAGIMFGAFFASMNAAATPTTAPAFKTAPPPKIQQQNKANR